MSVPFDLLNAALARQTAHLEPEHNTAFRLFNGFSSGYADLSIDIYGRTALLHDYSPAQAPLETGQVSQWLLEHLPWLRCIIQKKRNGTPPERKGLLLHGAEPDRKIRENGVWYALDLLMNRDASFYMDTRNLRRWAKQNLGGKSVLNTFAYTGSLGVAAMAGGASRVVQLDLNRNFLNLAKTSYTLNGFKIDKNDFKAADFFPTISQMKREGHTFDCVILDPPFFATTDRGTVNLESGSTALINKVRPLINHDGWLVAINNALFVSGAEYLKTLNDLCAGGYLRLEELIPVPEEFHGASEPGSRFLPADPAPFNHATKIALLRVKTRAGLAKE